LKFRSIVSSILALRESVRNPFFGFVNGHSHLSDKDLFEISTLVCQDSEDVLLSFEKAFAEIIGDGAALSFASGRMAFYETMRHLGVGKDDEVVLLGFTCSVMVNAVLRIGAIPVFADLDPRTFGSSVKQIEKHLSTKSKVVVAQHSFGIPCDIEPIRKLADERSIFLIEDCALSIGSKVNGISVGNFGDAAIFSTDHSKPINTLIGGLVYSRNRVFLGKMRESFKGVENLSSSKQRALWRRLLLERRLCKASRSGWLSLVDLLHSIKRKILGHEGPFLDSDGDLPDGSQYPYPARLPAFLAAIGLLEIKRWPEIERSRVEFLHRLLELFEHNPTRQYLPKAYFDKNLHVVPLRFAWSQPEGQEVRRSLGSFVKVSWTWFMKPIVGTSLPLESLGYQYGSCPNSERVGQLILNLPCNLSTVDMVCLIDRVKKFIK